MNRHFEDAQYYLKRAGKTATKGIREELEPLEDRLRELTGTEADPEPDGLDGIRADLSNLQGRAEGEAAEAMEKAREKMGRYRPTEREA